MYNALLKGFVMFIFVNSLILKGIPIYLKYLSEYDNVTVFFQNYTLNQGNTKSFFYSFILITNSFHSNFIPLECPGVIFIPLECPRVM